MVAPPRRRRQEREGGTGDERRQTNGYRTGRQGRGVRRIGVIRKVATIKQGSNLSFSFFLACFCFFFFLFTRRFDYPDFVFFCFPGAWGRREGGRLHREDGDNIVAARIWRRSRGYMVHGGLFSGLGDVLRHALCGNRGKVPAPSVTPVRNLVYVCIQFALANRFNRSFVSLRYRATAGTRTILDDGISEFYNADNALNN